MFKNLIFFQFCLIYTELNVVDSNQEEERLAKIIASYPKTYKTSGYTYKGKRAQVLHFLKARFTASATTYKGHSVSPVMSADLWTKGARYGVNNSRMPKMNAMAEFISKHLNTLNVRFV